MALKYLIPKGLAMGIAGFTFILGLMGGSYFTANYFEEATTDLKVCSMKEALMERFCPLVVRTLSEEAELFDSKWGNDDSAFARRQ